jgi:hypothetical protein
LSALWFSFDEGRAQYVVNVNVGAFNSSLLDVFAEALTKTLLGAAPPVSMSDVEEAFNQPPDPPAVKLCRPCSEKNVIEHSGYYGVKTTERALIHACDGGACECPLCDIARTAQEMTDYEKFMDRVDGWRD